MKNHKRTFRFVLGILLALVGVALVVFFIQKTGFALLVGQVHAFGLWAFAGFVGISLVNFGLYTLRWKIILHRMAPTAHVSFFALFLHRMSGYAFGYLTPGAQIAGEPVRVALLSTNNVPVSVATGSVVIDLACEIIAFAVYIFLGAFLALFLGFDMGIVQKIALGFMALGVGGITLFFFAIVLRWELMARVESLRIAHFAFVKRGVVWCKGVEDVMGACFAGKPKALFFVLALSLVMTGFRAFEVWYIARGFGGGLSLLGAVLMSTLPGLALFLPIPGGLGVFEASNMAMLTALGSTLPAIAFTVIIRARDLVFIAVGVAHGARTLLR